MQSNPLGKSQILRLKHVTTRTGLSRATIYRLMRAGTFPVSLRLGENSVGWLGDDIDAWLDQRIRASRAGATGIARREPADASARGRE
jgi:prophage regulatory protein